MRIIHRIFILSLFSLFIISCKTTIFIKNNIPASGTYIYSLAFAEFGGKSLGADCKVEIIGDSISVIHNGGNISGNKGDIIAAGHIRWHKATKQWIIAESENDIYADEVGGCSDGPIIVDFENKKVWLC